MNPHRFSLAGAACLGSLIACRATAPAEAPVAHPVESAAPTSTPAPKPDASTPPVGMRWVHRDDDLAIASPPECCSGATKLEVWNLVTRERIATLDASTNATDAGGGRRVTYCAPRVLVIDEANARLVLDARDGKMLQRNKIVAGTPLDCRHFEKAADKE